MIHSIAVTTDFSEVSRYPFGAAASLAKKFGARLYLVHVAEGAQIFTPWQLAEESPAEVERRQTALQRRLEDFAASEPAFAGTSVRARALIGESAGALSKFQKQEEIDLVVIASHGYTGLQHFLLGSFAAKVLQLISCPVLLYRVTREAAERSKAAFHPHRILVPQDFSPASAGAAELACVWAREFRAEARLLFVVERLASLYGYLNGGHDSVDQYLEKVRAEGSERLARSLREGWEGVRAEPKARIGHPAVEILKEAEEFKADLIVMASRGLSGLERLAMGSVAERTIQGATCPVLVVKQKDQAAKLLA